MDCDQQLQEEITATNPQLVRVFRETGGTRSGRQHGACRVREILFQAGFKATDESL